MGLRVRGRVLMSHAFFSFVYFLRDWSLITRKGGGGGGYKMGKPGVQNFLTPPPPQDRIKLFVPPLLKSGNFMRPPPIQYG